MGYGLKILTTPADVMCELHSKDYVEFDGEVGRMSWSVLQFFQGNYANRFVKIFKEESGDEDDGFGWMYKLNYEFSEFDMDEIKIELASAVEQWKEAVKDNAVFGGEDCEEKELWNVFYWLNKFEVYMFQIY